MNQLSASPKHFNLRTPAIVADEVGVSHGGKELQSQQPMIFLRHGPSSMGIFLTVLPLPSQKNTWKECHLDSLVSWLRMGIWSFIQWQQSRFRFHRVSIHELFKLEEPQVSTSARQVFKPVNHGGKWLGSGWWFVICLLLGDNINGYLPWNLPPFSVQTKNSTSGVACADHRVETNTICLKTQRR